MDLSSKDAETLRDARYTYRVASFFGLGGLAIGFRYWLIAAHWTVLSALFCGYIAICYLVLLVDTWLRIGAIDRELRSR